MRYFGTKERNHYHDLQTKYTAELLRKLLHDPAEFRLHIRSTAASVVLSLAYGYEVAGTHDKYVALLDRVTRIMNNAGVFGTYIVVSEPHLTISSSLTFRVHTGLYPMAQVSAQMDALCDVPPLFVQAPARGAGTL